jgi:hypothetical protein
MITDRELVEQMMARREQDGRFSRLVVSIVTSPQFRHQRGEDRDTSDAGAQQENKD